MVRGRKRLSIILISTYLKGWRGSVKARHFVLALQDYYQEKAANEKTSGLAGKDKWTLDYINIGAAQRIQEAFDADASGFITVQEVNNLTQMRPREWRFV